VDKSIRTRSIMRTKSAAQLALTACSIASSAASGASSTSSPVQDNANRIFNSIHNAMRQWGSSLDHNGMSMFFATVPAATEFYHGTPSEYRVNGTEWLAFEPEHALVFANCHGPPGKGHKGPPPPPPPASGDHLLADRLSNVEQDYRFVQQGDDRSNVHTYGRGPPENDDKHCGGYLHTYRTKRDLRLLYLDGQSAAKSDKGTLDVQDMILRDPGFEADSSSKDPGRRPGGPPTEQLRAMELCHRAETEWEGKIDGILRMEAGFEVILCSFKDNLDLLSIKQELPRESGPGLREPGEQLNYYQAVAARFDGIGGHRVSLDYDHFVSVYSYANATEIDPAGLPRVVNDTSTIKRIRSDVTEMLTLPRSSSADNIDWQATTDMIVARYADRIASLASKSVTTLDALHAGLDHALRPFIDYSNRNATEEVARCSSQFLSPEAIASNSTAAVAIKTTYTHICQSLSDALRAKTFDEAALLIRDLKGWLAWSTWKRCIGCQVDEACMVPIWPWGSKQDFEHPSCSNMTSIPINDYWGQPRG
jgi:hypothetical protein